MDPLMLHLFSAYYKARKHKANTINHLKFELNYEKNLLLLYDEIINRTYEPKQNIAFIIDKPVKREIFAADFRDRVIHHLIFGYINPIIEKKLIYDTYSCRKGKGTLFGINRVKKFMLGVSNNFQNEAWILKLDISGYLLYSQPISDFKLIPVLKHSVRNVTLGRRYTTTSN